MTFSTEAVSAVCSMPGKETARRRRSILALARDMHRRWRQRRELSMMDEIGLRDLALTSADAHYELKRPFWSGLSIAKRD